jgi:hypothetical protein
VQTVIDGRDDNSDLKLWASRVKKRNVKYEELRAFLHKLCLKNPKAEDYARIYYEDMKSGKFLPTIKGTYNLFYNMFGQDTIDVINVIQCPTYRKDILFEEVFLITT